MQAVGKSEQAVQAVGAFDVLLKHSTSDVHRLIDESRQYRELAESTMQGYLHGMIR